MTTPRKPLPASAESVAGTRPLASSNAASASVNPKPIQLSRQQIEQRLTVVDALIQSGDYVEAKNQTIALDVLTLGGQDRARLYLYHAQIDLSMGEAEAATSDLKQVQTQLLNRKQQVDYLQAQAFANSLLGNFLESAKARIELMPLLSDPEIRKQNQNAILDALVLMPNAELHRQSQDKSSDLPGWIALMEIVREKNLPDFDARLRQWRLDYPNNPAMTEHLTNQATSGADYVRYPGSIAVFLPESGTFAAAGKAVKAGIMAAFDQLSGSAYRPNLHFYDTTQAAPKELYLQAVAAGAELIIGPLEKDDVQRLADTTTLDVPVLALNHIPSLEQDNLYQFSLSPMDDVAQITERARLDGHKQALLLLLENNQTQRLADYFRDYWQIDDAILLKVQTYRSNTSDFSLVTDLLLNRQESVPNSEGRDPPNENKVTADALFIGGYASDASGINQQINSISPGNLAAYALPSVYTGQSNAAENQALNGITFCDMPWILHQGQFEWSATARQSFPDSYLPLVAMGIDAFNLSARLRDLYGKPFTGETGNLSLAEDNRIKRNLLCARFSNGKPQIIGFNDGQSFTEDQQPKPDQMPDDFIQ